MVCGMNAKTPGSDPIYKRIYACGEMVADLLRSLLPEQGLDIDPETLRRLPAEYVADDYRQRRGDCVWRVRCPGAPGGGWLHVLVLLEFQSTPQRRMALRVLEYTEMLYVELVRGGGLDADGRLPPVLPVVLYNGAAPWRSASQLRDLVAETGPALSAFQLSQRHLVLDERHAPADDPRLGDLTRAVLMLEQSRSVADLAQVAALLSARLDAPRDSELKRAFADWLATLVRRLEGDAGTALAAGEVSLEEVKMMLEERVAEWPKRYIRQGRDEGISLGRAEGISLGREEGIGLGRAEGISLGRAEGIGLGREEGISLGRGEGVAQQRGLLRRLTAARFGAATAARLADALASEADPDRLAAVGEAIVRCETSDELLRQAGAPV